MALRILFCGTGYGAGNIGDDSILNGLLIASRKYLPRDTEYGAISWNPAITTKFTGIKSWHYREEYPFQWATHCVLGGATLISERPSIVYPLRYCASVIGKAKKACMLAVGTSNVESEEALEIIRDVYDGKLGVISVRSEKDRERAESFGIHWAKLEVCADAAFADNLSATHKPKGFIGVSLVNEAFNSEFDFAKNVQEALKDKKVKGLCSETRKNPEYDFHVLKRVIGGDIFCEYVPPQRFVKELSVCNIVLTMRMHIMVFCSMIGVPVIPLIREEKMNLMADELGLTKRLYLNSTAAEIKNMIDNTDPDKLIVRPERINALRERALLNGAVLRKWINGGE